MIIFIAPINKVERNKGYIPEIFNEDERISVSHNIPIFITIIKSPNVNNIKGPNMSLNIGFTMKLIKVKITLTISKACNPPLNETPDIYVAVSANPTAFPIKRVINLIFYNIAYMYKKNKIL